MRNCTYPSVKIVRNMEVTSKLKFRKWVGIAEGMKERIIEFRLGSFLYSFARRLGARAGWVTKQTLGKKGTEKCSHNTKREATAWSWGTLGSFTYSSHLPPSSSCNPLKYQSVHRVVVVTSRAASNCLSALLIHIRNAMRVQHNFKM